MSKFSSIKLKCKKYKIEIVVTIATIFVYYLTNDFIVFFIPFLASCMTIYSHVQSNQSFEKIEMITSEIKEITIENNEILIEKQNKYADNEEFIKKLLREGVIEQREVQNILNDFVGEELISIHTYGAGLPKTLNKELNLPITAINQIILNLGFVRIFRNHSNFVIPKKDLPEQLQDIENLEAYLVKEIEQKWEEYQKEIARKFPEEKYPTKLRKWRDGEGFSLSYIIMKSSQNDALTGFLNKSTFTNDYIAKIFRRSIMDNSAPKYINEIKIREFVHKMSIKFLIEDWPKKSQILLINNEETFKESLKISSIIELVNIPKFTVESKLIEIGYNTEDAQRYSKSLIEQSYALQRILDDLGVIYY